MKEVRWLLAVCFDRLWNTPANDTLKKNYLGMSQYDRMCAANMLVVAVAVYNRASQTNRSRRTGRFEEERTMQLVMKTSLIVIIILAVTALGKKVPVTAGLITVMPLTGALALVWMYFENRGDPPHAELHTVRSLGHAAEHPVFSDGLYLF